MREKCKHPNGMEVKIGNVELDPCVYEEIEVVKNATVHVLKCKNCGHVEIEWFRGEEDDEYGIG